MAAKRRCAGRDPGPDGTVRTCPTLVNPGTPYCPAHARAREAARGTATRRGYGPAHRRLRAQWAPRVAAGDVPCHRCGTLIEPGTRWDLGHDDDDRTRYTGPEHENCNRRAGGRAAHR